jgi:hypothetical protein
VSYSTWLTQIGTRISEEPDVHLHGSASFLPLRWADQFPLQVWSQCKNIECPIREHCILDTTVRPSDLTHDSTFT